MSALEAMCDKAARTVAQAAQPLSEAVEHPIHCNP